VEEVSEAAEEEVEGSGMGAEENAGKFAATAAAVGEGSAVCEASAIFESVFATGAAGLGVSRHMVTCALIS